MPKGHIPIHVVLDKSEKHDNMYRPYNFEPTPRLYLELLENKAKIRTDLRDKEYIPPQEFIEQEQKRSEVDTKQEEKRSENKEEHSQHKEHRSEHSQHKEHRSEHSQYKEHRSERSQHKEHRSERSQHKEHRSEHSEHKEHHKHHHKEHGKRHEEKEHHHKHYHKHDSRLKEILKTGSHEKSKTSATEKKLPPPSLAELQSGIKGDGRLHVSPYASTGSTEELARKKILIRKLELLRQRNPSIPIYTELTDLATLERDNMIYERQTHIETSIDSYKKYLIVAFTGIEWFIGYMIGLDARGLADSQMKNMKPYEDLLVELSEKTYVEPNRRMAL